MLESFHPLLGSLAEGIFRALESVDKKAFPFTKWAKKIGIQKKAFPSRSTSSFSNFPALDQVRFEQVVGNFRMSKTESCPSFCLLIEGTGTVD